MADNKRWKCLLCGELMTEQETADLTYVVFHATRYEPAEYAGRCANQRCNGTHEDQEEIWLCDHFGCTNEATEDDLCEEHWAILEHEGTLDPGGDADAAELMMEDR